MMESRGAATERNTRQERRTTVAAVADQLEDEIRTGAWSPGDRIPSIRILAERYRVSNVTMSRAVRQLSDRGVLRSESRRGTYVAERPHATITSDGIGFEVQRSFLRRYPHPRSLSVSVKSPSVMDTINLASGTMASNAVPPSAIKLAIREVATQHAERSFATIPSNGEPELRAWVSRHLEQFGFRALPDNVVITSGSQQGRKLVTEALIEPGDVVLIEQPAYPFALSTFEAAGARCIGVPVDSERGIRLDILEHLVDHHRPKALYTVSTGQIPTGLTMTLEQRRHLVDLATRRGFLILESDAGNELYYDGYAPNAIKALDPGGLVVYLKSFSRVVAAGLRVGAVVVEGPLRDAIIDRKVTNDLVTSTISQEVFLAYVSRRDFQHNIDATREHYLVRRDAALQALAATMPDGVTWTIPTAGLHTWLTLPDHVSSREIAERALDHGVVVAHSEIFMPGHNPDNGIRVTFSDTDPLRIAMGIERLSGAIASSLGSPGRHDAHEYMVKVL